MTSLFVLILQPGRADLTRIQTSALFQDINFKVGVIFNSSNDGARNGGTRGAGQMLRKACTSQNGSGENAGACKWSIILRYA